MHKVIQTLYAGFVSLGDNIVYISKCCNRFYMGLAPAVKCRTCEKIPNNYKVTNEEDILQWKEV